MRSGAEIKAEQIARMIVKGVPKVEIAREMGMQYGALMQLTVSPEYKRIEDEVRCRIIRRMDERLEQRARMVEDVEDAVPEALQVLLDNVRQKKNLRAALELLDRDPHHTLVKASRQEANNKPPEISSEALAHAVKEANWTEKLIEQASALDAQKPAEA